MAKKSSTFRAVDKDKMTYEELRLERVLPEPDWVQRLRPANREAFIETRLEDIDEYQVALEGVIARLLPCATEDNETLRKAALRLSILVRDEFELGMQHGIESEQLKSAQSDAHNHDFMQRALGNWAG